MDFDPAQLPRWAGRVVGDGWQRAPNMSAWANISLGRLPYELVKEAYRHVLVVVDDANHVTAPWGSVNSRVFDALAAGALVVSNGAEGVRELFGAALRAEGLDLPVYAGGAELARVLDFYLAHEEVRQRTVRVMRAEVQAKHSYRLRAQQLGEMLREQFGVPLLPAGQGQGQ
eukprot:gene1331-1660_t